MASNEKGPDPGRSGPYERVADQSICGETRELALTLLLVIVGAVLTTGRCRDCGSGGGFSCPPRRLRAERVLA